MFIVKSLEVIGKVLHKNELSNNFADASWDQDSKSTAIFLLHGLTDFEFIVVFLTAYYFLSYLSGISVKLQSTTIHIIDAYQQINKIKEFYREIYSLLCPEIVQDKDISPMQMQRIQRTGTESMLSPLWIIFFRNWTLNFQLWLKMHHNFLVWFLQFCAKGRYI